MSDGQGVAASHTADWYPDPLDPASIRYWDGARWTEHTAPAPSAAAPAPVHDDLSATLTAPVLPAAADSVQTAAAGRRPRSRKGLIAGIVVACCLLLLVGAALVTAMLLNAGPRSATALVTSYVDAVAAGDAATANRLVDPGVPEESRKLLTNDVLRAADARISVADVTLVREDGSGATVDAVLTQHGKSVTHRFSLSKRPNDLLVLDNWELQDGLAAPVTVSVVGPDPATVGSVTIPGSKQWMYPGDYTLSVPKSTYFDAETQSLTVSPDPTGVLQGVAFERTPTSALTDKVLAAVRSRVTACAGVPTNMDAACPAATRNTDLASLSVVSQPNGLSALDISSFESDPAVIVTQANSRGGYTPRPQRTTFTLRGEITWKNGEPEISFDGQ